MSRSTAEIDCGAIVHNIAQLRRVVGPDPLLCAVVKADAYGHGAVAVAETVLAAGAAWLAVAHPLEGAALRDAGIDAPILLLSEPVDAAEAALVAAFELRAAVYSDAGIDALAETGRRVAVHLKVDTGMRRVGAEPGDVLRLARRVARSPLLELEGVWTHCAVADEPSNPFTGQQLERFADTMDTLRRDGVEVPLRHAANSATCITQPAAGFDLVRPGITLYGVAPAPALAGRLDLRPALTWTSHVSWVKRVRAGEGVSYGHVHHMAADSVLATVPVGYADGLPRRWGLRGGSILIAGHRRPIVGAVTMDQVIVDCGADPPVSRGDEVVLIGRQGSEQIAVDEIAAATETISYEVLTGIGQRVLRRYH